MTKQQILDEVTTSQFQPEFEFTDDLNAVVDSILKPHEDYFLNLHDKVEEIIAREIKHVIYDEVDTYKITFGDVCNWQKELFEYKLNVIKNLKTSLDFDDSIDYMRSKDLPNQHINLGLRTTNVKVGQNKWRFWDSEGFEKEFDNHTEMKIFSAEHSVSKPENYWSNYEKVSSAWTPPHPMFLEDLKEMCFPITVDNTNFVLDLPYYNGANLTRTDWLQILTEWYKIFETIYPLEDLNGRIGGIVINILSYLLTGKYLINTNY